MKRKPFKYRTTPSPGLELRETAASLEETDYIVNVRAAKDNLSSLLERAAQGDEVIITSDGQPKAKLVPVRTPRAVFRVNWDLLHATPLARATPSAEDLVRQDRDDRP